MSTRFSDSLSTRFISSILSGLLFAKTLHLRFMQDYFEEKATPLQKLTEEARNPVESSIRAELIVWIRDKLRRYPYWARGHLEIAKQSFYLEDLQLSYASALATRTLSRSPKIFSRASFILGRGFVKAGQPLDALKIFDEVKTKPLTDISKEALIEEKAAAFFALDDLDQTFILLESIPAMKRSGFAQSVLDFITRKKDGTLE